MSAKQLIVNIFYQLHCDCKGTTFFSFLQDIAQKNCHSCAKTQMAIRKGIV